MGRALSAAKGVLLGVAVLLAALWLIRGVEFAALGAVVAAVIALVEYGRELTQPQDRTVKDPADAERLMDEAALAMAIRQWPGNVTDAEWVMGQLQRGLDPPSVAPRFGTWRALRSARRELAREPGLGSESDSYDRVRSVLAPVLAVLPDEETYQQAIKHIPPELRVTRLKAGYRRKVSQGDDFWAWNYLLLLDDLGETEALLELLKERLVDMWKAEGGDPDVPPRVHKKAFVETARLAEKVKGTAFWTWYEEEVKGSLPP